MLNKPLEYWIAVVGMVLYVATRDAERQPILKRTVKTFVSAALGVGLGADVAAWFGTSEAIAAVAIMAFGMIILDAVTALISDPAFIKDFIRNRLGGGSDNGRS